MKKKSKIIITFFVISVILIISILPVAAASAESEYFSAYDNWQHDKTNTFIFDNRSFSTDYPVQRGIYMISLPSSDASFSNYHSPGTDVSYWSIVGCDNVKTGFFIFDPLTKSFSNVSPFSYYINTSYSDLSVFSKYSKLSFNDVSYSFNDTKVSVLKHFPFSFSNLKSNDFLTVLNQIKYLVPIIIPAVVGFLAFRKGWAFLKGEVRSA